MDHTCKAIFLDIDGTLVAHGQGSPCAEDIAQIERCRQAGHKIFLNTGRALSNIPAEFTGAPWLDGIIAGGGAHVLLAAPDREQPRLKTFYHRWIEPEMLRTVCALFIKTGTWCFFEGETDLYALNPGAFEIPMAPFYTIKKDDDFLTKYQGTLISKLTMDGDITAEEEKLLGGAFHLYPQKGYHEGIIKEESKSKGMGIVLDYLNIKQTDSIAIGDSANDMDMIRFAGTGIAMGNACGELKAIAAHITGDVYHAGVCTALKQFAPA